MTSRDEGTLLDVIQAARLATEFASGLDEVAFGRDLKTQSAVLHQLMLLGEAVRRLSQVFRDQQPQVPWKAIAGMRDRLIHGYDAVDLDEVWRTVQSDLPALLGQLEAFAPRPPST